MKKTIFRFVEALIVGAALVVLAERLKGTVPTPLAIVGIAVGSFAISSLVSIAIRRIPLVGKLVVG